MPTQRKNASSKSSSRKSTGSSKTSQSRSRQGSSSARGAQSRSGTKKSQSRSTSKTSSRSGSKGARKQSAGTKRASGRGKTPNALELLMQDHREVQKNFRKAERMESGDRGLEEIVRMTCAALTQHAEIEEQLFYPALRERAEDEELVPEALVEHDSAKQLIAQLEGMRPGDERYKATFKVLGEYVNHHIEEEESRIFRAAKRAKLDLEALGLEIMSAKEMGGDAEGMPRTAAGGTGAKRSGSGSGSGSRASGTAEPRKRQGGRGTRASGAAEGVDATERNSASDDEEMEAGTMGGRGGGDTGDDTERPGRGGRSARGTGVDSSGDDSEIDIETPGSSRHGAH